MASSVSYARIRGRMVALYQFDCGRCGALSPAAKRPERKEGAAVRAGWTVSGDGFATCGNCVKG